MTTPAESPLSATADAFYAEILAEGGSNHVRDPNTSQAIAIAELLRVGLLGLSNREEEQGLLVAAVNPRRAARRWKAALLEDALEQIHLAEQHEQQMDALAKSFQEAAPSLPAADAEYEIIVGRLEINHVVGQLSAGSTREILTLHPNPRTEALLRRGLAIDLELARRPGMDYRTLYPTSERKRPEIIEVVKMIAAGGARYRNLWPLPGRLFLFDAHTAVIEAPTTGVDGQWVACCLTDPPLVAYLRALFQHLWDRAQPLFDETESNDADAGLDPNQRSILRLLHEGLSHTQISRRLDLNERTVAAHISQLKDKFAVTSLFQLGAEAVGRGLL